MKKSKTKILVPFILLALLVVVSGCIGQSNKAVVGQNGLVITDFYTDPPETNIESGELMDVSLFVENVGGTTAKNIQAELLGADWMSRRVYPTIIDTNNDGIPDMTFQLLPPNPQLGSSGETRMLLWKDLPTPYVPEGLRKTYDLKARVTYDYSTKAGATLKAYSKDWYDMLLQQGKTTPVASNALIPVAHTIDPTPIVISMQGPDKIIVPKRNYQSYTYKITFTNVGGGTPITADPTNGAPTDGLILGRIWMNGPGYFVDCMGIGPDTIPGSYANTPSYYAMMAKVVQPIISYYPGYTEQQLISIYSTYPYAVDFRFMPNYVMPIKLRQGESVTKSCTIAVPNPDMWGNSWGIDPMRSESSMTLFFDFDYRYYLDADTTITVTGPITGVPSPSQIPPGQQQPAGGGIYTPTSGGTPTSTQFCGNGVIDSGEECDGTNLGGNTCESLGFNGGVLRCSASCTFNTNSCTTLV